MRLSLPSLSSLFLCPSPFHSLSAIDFHLMDTKQECVSEALQTERQNSIWCLLVAWIIYTFPRGLHFKLIPASRGNPWLAPLLLFPFPCLACCCPLVSSPTGLSHEREPNKINLLHFHLLNFRTLPVRHIVLEYQVILLPWHLLSFSFCEGDKYYRSKEWKKIASGSGLNGFQSLT